MGIDVLALIKSLGYMGIWITVFLESGVIFFFFLPGDSLLFTAGFIASQGFLHIGLLIFGCFFAAVTGNSVGYLIGKTVGMRLFRNGDSRLLKRKHLDMTERFYEKHGAVAIITARFMPIIRTFVPFLAGVVQMPYKQFMLYNIVGAALWAVGVTLLGYFLGRIIPPDQVDKYLLPIILAIIVLSFMPSVIHILRDRKAARTEEG